MMQEAEKAPINIFFMLPSCVPATPFETSGAKIKAADLQQLIEESGVLGLAELMNVPGVLQNDSDILQKLAFTWQHNKLIDGHSPLVSGAALSAYAAAGVSSDHECSTEAEVKERLSRGMTVFMREGSAGQNVSALSRTVTVKNSRFFCLCTDDASPDDVFQKGHINNVIRRSVQCGVDPVEAIRMATINTAEHFGLKTKGAVAPGFDADLVVLDNLSDFNVRSVFIKGVEVARDGEMLSPVSALTVQTTVTDTVNIKSINQEDLRIYCPSGKARVIGLKPGDLVTEHLIEKVQTGADGLVSCCDNPQLLKLAVIERHHASGNIGLGLVKGFTQQGQCMHGAIGSTIAHDSHNIMVIGDNDADMLEAVQALKRQQGGIVLIRDGQVVESLTLEIAGLMTSEPAKETARRKSRLIDVAHEKFHVAELIHPVMALSFLSLAVILFLRVTDSGLFDSEHFRFVNLDATDSGQ